jgi:hypothetical protein
LYKFVLTSITEATYVPTYDGKGTQPTFPDVYVKPFFVIFRVHHDTPILLAGCFGPPLLCDFFSKDEIRITSLDLRKEKRESCPGDATCEEN